MSNGRQERKYLIACLLIVIVLVSFLAVSSSYYYSENPPKADRSAYIGVAFGGNTTTEAKQLIDRVKGYTNLFVLDSGRNPISRNQSSVEEIVDYAVAAGLSVIINMGIVVVNNMSDSTWFWQQPNNDTIKSWSERWGDKFLGVYYNDELGGIQLDSNWAQWFQTYGQELKQIDHPSIKALNDIYYKMLNAMANNNTEPQDYDLEANFFVNTVVKGDPGLEALNAMGVTAYMSDYGLYWWDYLGGYNVLLTELGWNVSVAEQIALIRGAARLQNKDWGAIITWKYNQTPYLDTGPEIYDQMATAYEAGAKYIVVFNYPYDGSNDYGVMDDQQFLALQRFWDNYVQHEFDDLSAPRAAFVLPQNYGWGMRYPNDTIWGFWPADSKSQQIAIGTSTLLAKYGVTLDIVYDDPAYPVTKVSYQDVYYWNSTNIQ